MRGEREIVLSRTTPKNNLAFNTAELRHHETMKLIRSTLVATLATCLLALTSSAAPLRVLFLGYNAGHRPTNRFALLQPALSSRGIEMTYTDKLDDLNPTNLGGYDALVI